MLIGYMRVSKADGFQSTDLQRDALLSAGVEPGNLYEDHASGKNDDRPELAACLKGMRDGDTLLVWKLDRLGRNLHHLVNTVHDLTTRGIGLRVLTGQGATIDTTTVVGKLIFGIFAALAEFERELISERTKAGMASARARGHKGGRPFTMTPAKIRLVNGRDGPARDSYRETRQRTRRLPTDPLPVCLTHRRASPSSATNTPTRQRLAPAQKTDSQVSQDHRSPLPYDTIKSVFCSDPNIPPDICTLDF